MDTLFILARILHVIGVVLWIGGVAFVTTVLIPAIRRISDKNEKLALFDKLERKFSFQAKITTVITGISGFYMLESLNAWNRYLDLSFWWIHLMTLVWLIFTLLLFVLEPLIFHKIFHEKAMRDPDKAFRQIHIMHIFLLTLSLVAILGAVAGVRGYL
ncbi:MAG: hypothetical protein OEZ36_03025 [Spirochaetota bacterium]|nr:hypothetical protein [Spirochaetota bacterium]